MQVGPYAQDLVSSIINVQWAVDQQGLLGTYAEVDGSVGPVAYALDSDQTFDGVNMGASGLGFTVLTPGLVCFGKPRDGAACFLASGSGFDPLAPAQTVAIRRGITGEDGELQWTTVDSGKLIALTFANEAFFAVYADDLGRSETVIATSFDGETFVRNSAFPAGSEFTGGLCGGAVAGLVVNEGTADERRIYVACGGTPATEDRGDHRIFTTNLAWATSATGDAWAYGSNSGLGDPGTWTGDMSFGKNQAATVAAGNEIFVAAAARKTDWTDEGSSLTIPLTSAAAKSGDGSSWTTSALPGAASGNQGESSSQCVTFVRTTKPDAGSVNSSGYFLCAGYGRQGPQNRPKGGVWRSDNGASWTQVVDNALFNWTLCAIASDLDKTTIVRL